MKLTAENVETAFRACLFQKGEIHGEIPANAVLVEGVMENIRFGFHPERLESYRQNVYEMLSELPDQFREDKGGGWGFLNACMTNENVQWGEHLHMQQLFCLGIGLKQVEWLMRSMQDALPGGMPYVRIAKSAAGFEADPNRIEADPK
jgi:hypothetical protein